MRLWSLALLVLQSTVAIRNIRTSHLLNGNDDGSGDVGPGATNPNAATNPNGAKIVNGYAPAILVEKQQQVKIKEVKLPETKTNAVVTKEFCLQVLKDVATRQPPYFLEGKFTGECRKSLVDQCGDRVCEWAKHYKNAASDCPQCPNSCDVSSRTAFFSAFPSSLQVVGTQHFFMVVQHEMLTHSGSGSGTLPVAPRFQQLGSGSGSGSGSPMAARSNMAAPSNTGTVSNNGPATDPCPVSGCPRTEVTKSFCKQMLQDVVEGKAPYFLEGKFTGETRTDLIAQCSLHICGWAMKIQIAGVPQCGDSACCLPQTCKMPKEYLKDVIAKGQLLDVIKLVGNSQDFIKNMDPYNPPKSLPAQQAPPSTNLRGPLTIEKLVLGGPTPNDPRDPDFKKNDKKVEADEDDDADAKQPKKKEKKDNAEKEKEDYDEAEKEDETKKDEDDKKTKKKRKKNKEKLSEKDDDDN